MTEPTSIDPPAEAEAEPAPHGSLDAYREDIARNAAGAAVHAQLAVTYADIACDAGMAYALRCAVACLRAAIGSLNDLQQDKRRMEAHRERI